MERERIIASAVRAATANVNWVTSDRIEALTGGHGMLNMAVIAIANVLAEELLRGIDIQVKFANVRHQPIEDVLTKAIVAAKDAGADAANAALLSATMLYMVGANAQVGVPAGNRKLGATARMIAKVDRCGVAAIPTGKMNNKISGFPAVQAVYRAMLEHRLSPISGESIPQNVGGGPIYGHSALGEDIIYPAMTTNGARIGTQAMLDALSGAAMPVHPFTAALFGAAAILEIVNPEAYLPEQYGPHGAKSAYLAGKTAAETAGLPAKLHMKITEEEYDTGKFIGDMGLILKDIGGPSVIGMMAFEEIMASFKEGIAGGSGGPLNPPLGHVCADAVVALKALLHYKGDQDTVASALFKLREEVSIDSEIALISMNTVARKASEILHGPVTDTLILASEPVLVRALYRRAARAYEELSSKKSLAEVVRLVEQERQATVEARASAMFSQLMGKEVKVKVTRLEPGARKRKGHLPEKYLAFDAMADVEVTVDGETAKMEGFAHDLVPKVAKGERSDIAWAVPLAAAVIDEMYLVGNVIINVTVPAAVAVGMGLLDPKEAAVTGQDAGYITAGIPGTRMRAENICKLMKRIMERN